MAAGAVRRGGRSLPDFLPPARRSETYKASVAVAVGLAGGTGAQLEARARDHNLLIGQALAKANDIFVTWRLSKEVLTLDRFKRDFATEGSKNDFIAYFRAKIIERHRKEKISDVTRKNHFSTFNALYAFRPSIPFNTLTTDFADEFDAYLKKYIKSLNTRWGRHKDVKTYLALARKDRMKFEDPYQDFKNRDEPGKWKALKPAELEKLEAYYKLCGPRTVHRRVLCKFLFSCSSSLRLGDLKQIGQCTIENYELTFKAQKTYSKTLREMMLPLTRKALRYLQDAQEEEEQTGFYNYTDQYSNRVLCAIGKTLDIESRLHHHAGRETFATEFMRRGGKLEVLQKLLDHAKITTTMKYVHVDNDMKRAAIDHLNALDEAA
ncbi:site-specific integrase [Hymenobacter humi]|uniref:Site-specific integrase n=1 Tax=Hymenobacter humi TaxID=1411620 RepID=A0ABW2U734_9BACT